MGPQSPQSVWAVFGPVDRAAAMSPSAIGFRITHFHLSIHSYQQQSLQVQQPARLQRLILLPPPLLWWSFSPRPWSDCELIFHSTGAWHHPLVEPSLHWDTGMIAKERTVNSTLRSYLKCKRTLFKHAILYVSGVNSNNPANSPATLRSKKSCLPSQGTINIYCMLLVMQQSTVSCQVDLDKLDWLQTRKKKRCIR